MIPPPVVVAVLVILLVALLLVCVRIVPEYQRAIVFRLGRLRGPLGPGLVFLLPGLDKLVRVDLRVVTLTIPPQEVITRDNVTARVNAVVLFRVVDPVSSVMEVENHAVATSQIAQTSLRSVVGRADLDTLLAAWQEEDLLIPGGEKRSLQYKLPGTKLAHRPRAYRIDRQKLAQSEDDETDLWLEGDDDEAG